MPASHYTWGSASTCTFYPDGQYCFNGDYSFVPSTPSSSFQIAATSDGDLPLHITSVVVSVVVSGSATRGIGTATAMAPTDPVTPGSSFVLNVTFDPSTIHCTGSSYGYNDLLLAPDSDAGNLVDWKTIFTVSGVPYCNTMNE